MHEVAHADVVLVVDRSDERQLVREQVVVALREIVSAFVHGRDFRLALLQDHRRVVAT